MTDHTPVPDTNLSYLTGLHIVLMLVEALSPSPNNARTHSKKQIQLLAECIKEFGFLFPILIDSNIPATLTLVRLKEDIPLDWNEQRSLFGFSKTDTL